MDNDKDKELIIRLKTKSEKEAAFSDLINQYQQRLYWRIRHLVVIHADADDVLQNVLIKIWNGIEKFREDSTLSTWLYRIAINESLTFIEQRKKKSFANTDSETSNYLLSLLHSDIYFDGDKAQELLFEAIETLPKKQRVVFNMRYFDEVKYTEMQEILNTSEGALKASYHHAVNKISEYIRNSNIIEFDET